jgi:hypothetical protein
MQNHFSSTETFRAAHNLTIQYDSSSWRLYNGAQAPAHQRDQANSMMALFVAQPNGITCMPAFAQARKLPKGGQLDPADIARVVVGWAPESRNWHLGVLLAAQPESGFKPHWCGLASWPSGPANESYDQARLAGLALARMIRRPFHLVPAPEPVPPMSGDTQPIQVTRQMYAVDAAHTVAQAGSRSALQSAARSPEQVISAPAPKIRLNAPPFEFEDWVMQETSWGFAWRRRARWALSAVVRAVGYAVLAVLFVLLGIGTQTRGLAAVDPVLLPWVGIEVAVLPWIGIAVAVMLAGLAIRAVWAILVMTNVAVDMTRKEVRCQRRFGGQQRWRVPFDEIAYVLVSQTPIRLEGRDDTTQTVNTSQDVWLHIYDGAQFWTVAELGRVEGRCWAWEHVRRTYRTKGRRHLKLALYDTPAHHAACVLANAMGLDVWLDIR